MSRQPLLTRTSAPLLGLLALVGTARAQGLLEVVPASAYSVEHRIERPEIRFLRAHEERVIEEVLAADLDGFVVDLLEGIGGREDDVAQLSALLDIAGDLLSDVPWRSLFGTEWLYAEAPRPGYRHEFFLPSVLFTARCPDGAIADVERSLVRTLEVAAEITGLPLDRGRGLDDETRTYGLREPGGASFVDLAVRGDVVLVVSGSELYRDALELLEEGRGERLTQTRSFRRAAGELPADRCTLTYLDVPTVVRRAQNAAYQWMGGNKDVPDEVRWLVGEAMQMAECVESTLCVTRAEDLTVIKETWTHFAENPADNPFLRALDVPASRELLDFVPADAISFRMGNGFDPVPVYRWLRDEIMPEMVPDAEEALLVWNTAQAVLDLDVERDVLSWVGSESISITLPAARPTPMQPEDSVHIVRLRDPAGARKVLARAEAVYEALVPPLFDRMRNEVGGDVALPEVMLHDDVAFPGMKRIRMKLTVPYMGRIPVPDTLYGMIGNMLVFASSEEALQTVLEVAAGERPGLEEHPAFPEGIPEGALTGAALTPTGRQIQAVVMGLTQASAVVSTIAPMVAQKSPREGHLIQLATSILPRVTRILRSIDFIEDTRAFESWQKRGRVAYRQERVRYTQPALVRHDGR